MKINIVRTRGVRDYLISLILFLGGCVLVALPSSDSVNITGFFLIITGMILVVMLNTSYKEEHCGARFRKKEIYFPCSCREEIYKCLNGRCEEIPKEKSDKGNGLRLDVYYNRKKNVAYMQMLEYVPYKYIPVTDLVKTDTEKVRKLIN